MFLSRTKEEVFFWLFESQKHQEIKGIVGQMQMEKMFHAETDKVSGGYIDR